MTLNEQIKFLSGRRPSLNPVVSFYLDVDGSRYSPIQCIEIGRASCRERV